MNINRQPVNRNNPPVIVHGRSYLRSAFERWATAEGLPVEYQAMNGEVVPTVERLDLSTTYKDDRTHWAWESLKASRLEEPHGLVPVNKEAFSQLQEEMVSWRTKYLELNAAHAKNQDELYTLRALQEDRAMVYNPDTFEKDTELASPDFLIVLTLAELQALKNRAAVPAPPTPFPEVPTPLPGAETGSAGPNSQWGSLR